MGIWKFQNLSMMTRSDSVSNSHTQKERTANSSGVVFGCDIRKLKRVGLTASCRLRRIGLNSEL